MGYLFAVFGLVMCLCALKVLADAQRVLDRCDERIAELQRLSDEIEVER